MSADAINKRGRLKSLRLWVLVPIFLLVSCGGCCAMIESRNVGGPRSDAKWAEIEQGMGIEEISALLGEPIASEHLVGGDPYQAYDLTHWEKSILRRNTIAKSYGFSGNIWVGFVISGELYSIWMEDPVEGTRRLKKFPIE